MSKRAWWRVACARNSRSWRVKRTPARCQGALEGLASSSHRKSPAISPQHARSDCSSRHHAAPDQSVSQSVQWSVRQSVAGLQAPSSRQQTEEEEQQEQQTHKPNSRCSRPPPYSPPTRSISGTASGKKAASVLGGGGADNTTVAVVEVEVEVEGAHCAAQHPAAASPTLRRLRPRARPRCHTTPEHPGYIKKIKNNKRRQQTKKALPRRRSLELLATTMGATPPLFLPLCVLLLFLPWAPHTGKPRPCPGPTPTHPGSLPCAHRHCQRPQRPPGTLADPPAPSHVTASLI